MVISKKKIPKKKGTKKKKNTTKTYVDGKEQEVEEVPDKVPDLEVPTPPPDEKQGEPLNAQTVYEEGRSVGFQEGMIYCLQIIDDNLKQHQEELRKKIALKQKEMAQ